MQVSKELLIAEFSKIVSEYESLYARFGDASVWYNQAVGKINGLGFFFYKVDPEVDAAYDLAFQQIGNIYVNGDKADFSRPRPRDEQLEAYELAAEAALAKQDAQSEPVATVHIHGDDFVEVLTESDFEPEKAVVDESLKRLMVNSIWSRLCRPKPRRGVRLLTQIRLSQLPLSYLPISFVSERGA